MRKAIQFAGVVLALQGFSGAIDRVFVQPVMGIVLNFFNRVIIPRVDLLTGYELFANLALAALGVVLIIAAERAPR
ncbi:hypothetical protein LDL08_29060 [Nonomuraea glycinis]|uniref:Uncharacterized protein n=1 Tax=Nonomuraea glycinis TaxID=2047744 RepID=A0A918A1E6_9ACTN|nr:hypothetical protein [Nonomuraea glycinis]MCA2180237.1 hypothetical protein [Nonomuraea glycinis]GGP03814.1 hypothetical protein GCM10012278_16610 [Nonomuraea glycinis]